jgi:hypothetical protein
LLEEVKEGKIQDSTLFQKQEVQEAEVGQDPQLEVSQVPLR